MVSNLSLRVISGCWVSNTDVCVPLGCCALEKHKGPNPTGVSPRPLFLVTTFSDNIIRLCFRCGSLPISFFIRRPESLTKFLMVQLLDLYWFQKLTNNCLFCRCEGAAQQRHFVKGRCFRVSFLLTCPLQWLIFWFLGPSRSTTRISWRLCGLEMQTSIVWSLNTTIWAAAASLTPDQSRVSSMTTLGKRRQTLR